MDDLIKLNSTFLHDNRNLAKAISDELVGALNFNFTKHLTLIIDSCYNLNYDDTLRLTIGMPRKYWELLFCWITIFAPKVN